VGLGGARAERTLSLARSHSQKAHRRERRRQRRLSTCCPLTTGRMLHPSRLPGVLARAAHPSSPPRRNSCLEHIARFRAPRALRRRTKVQLSWVFRPFAQPPKNHRLAKRTGEGSWSGPDRVRKPAQVALGRRRTSPPRCVRPPNVDRRSLPSGWRFRPANQTEIATGSQLDRR